jgi:hypothetical protein
MSPTSEKSSKPAGTKSLWSTQNLVVLAVALGFTALLFYLLFSVSLPGEGRPYWYGIGTLVFEQLGLLLAAWLCLRNGFSPQVVSGRNVWLGIGFGMLSYFIGNLIFSWWELYWNLNPAVSPADFFYVISYIFLTGGMILAVKSRRLNLELWQWGSTAGIALAGLAFAAWIAWPLELGYDAAAAAEAAELSTTTLPTWVVQMQQQLDPYANYVNLAYILLDVILLVVATLLLLAFWGGRFSQSWRMIAAAAFSLYIADMWYKYAEKNITDYESGDLLEVFFVFMGVCLAIGAVLEYDVSTRSTASPRRSRRRGGGA